MITVKRDYVAQRLSSVAAARQRRGRQARLVGRNITHLPNFAAEQGVVDERWNTKMRNAHQSRHQNKRNTERIA